MRGRCCGVSLLLLLAASSCAAAQHGHSQDGHTSTDLAELSLGPDQSDGQRRQTLQQKHCPALSKELLAARAINNVVIVSVVDQVVMKKFGRSFVMNARDAGITYWFVAALDPWTSIHLATELGCTNECFNAPLNRLQYQATGSQAYQWGSHHWHQTTWNKVHVIKAVYELGFHVIHADTDVTWFADPMPYFGKYLNGPAHALFTTDSLETFNKADDQGYEQSTNPYTNINTGVYFVRQYTEGLDFFKVWLNLSKTDIGHDQDGLNTVVRGEAFHGDKRFPPPFQVDQNTKTIKASMHPITTVSFLPVSMFGNHYTYVNGKPHEKLGHPLYEVHWVWSGSTMESKVQSIRDTKKFWDPPEYYNPPTLVTFDLWRPEAWPGYNETKFEETEKMIQFHIYAANAQLQQTYYGFMAALVLNRTLVMPRFHCFCAKNWYMTQSCRINGERHGTFPYDCALSHLMRVKRLVTTGVKLDGQNLYHDHVVHIREYSFMENKNVPDTVKKSRLVIAPDPASVRGPADSVTIEMVKQSSLPDGSVQALVPWPLSDVELSQLIGKLAQGYRVVHFTNATQVLGRGMADTALHNNFDSTMVKLVTHWCCRFPEDMYKLHLSERIDLTILPHTRAPPSPPAAPWAPGPPPPPTPPPGT